jgi:hypothetical protein
MKYVFLNMVSYLSFNLMDLELSRWKKLNISSLGRSAYMMCNSSFRLVLAGCISLWNTYTLSNARGYFDYVNYVFTCFYYWMLLYEYFSIFLLFVYFVQAGKQTWSCNLPVKETRKHEWSICCVNNLSRGKTWNVISRIVHHDAIFECLAWSVTFCCLSLH